MKTRAHAGRRHARAVPAETGYHVTNAIVWAMFAVAVAGLTMILGGPFLYQIGF